MTFRRFVVWLMISAFLLARIEVFAQSHEQGVAAGAAANAVIRGLVNAPSATAVVPGYTNAPPETAYAGRPSLGADANAKLAACALTPNDPTCQALRNAVNSANTPRPAIGASDPAVMAASRIARNPSVALGSLAAFYSGCTTSEVTSQPGTETRICSRYIGVGSLSCSNHLAVAVERQANCPTGEWFAHASSGGTALDAQCLPDRPPTRQRFRVTSGANPLTHFDTDLTAPVRFPEVVAEVGTTLNWMSGTVTRVLVWVADKTCAGTACSLTALVGEEARELCTGNGADLSCTSVQPFIETLAACPNGTQSGDKLIFESCSGSGETYGCAWVSLNPGTCYGPSSSSSDIAAHDSTGTFAATHWISRSARPVSGWAANPAYGSLQQVKLTYTLPASTAMATDTWTSNCPALAGNGRCTTASAPRCVDGPSTKVIDGTAVTRDCWAYETTLSCASAINADQCEPLLAAGCTSVASSCRRTNAATGECEISSDQYSCPVAGETTTTASNCPNDVFCLGASCFNIRHANDADFARSLSMLEATRQSGVYLDSDRMQVFKGEANHCRDKLLKNCCFTDGAGRGMTNQSVFGSGTRLVYDVLMNSENRQFVMQGMSALLTGAGFSGTFSTYGFTIAVNGAALPAGSTALFASSTVAGEGVVVAFDPWSLAISVIMYVVLSVMACNEEEARLALKEGAKLCHAIGTHCSSCVRILGVCVACIEHTTTKCCFNSMLARIVNEQGRVQVGKGWGGSENPDCSGFTVAQLQSLDFAAMDFTEFYASLVPTSPNVTTLQTNSASRVPACYYGQGRCQ